MITEHFAPLVFNLENKPCTVIGGGRVAERKVEKLLQAGAKIKVVSPTLTPCLAAHRNYFRHIERTYRQGDTEGAFLVVAATNRSDINRLIYEHAREQVPLINIVDHPRLCTFFFPATVNRGGLSISVSTAGNSPSLAKSIRRRLETLFGPEYEELVRNLGRARRTLLEKKKQSAETRKVIGALLELERLHFIANLEKLEMRKPERIKQTE